MATGNGILASILPCWEAIIVNGQALTIVGMAPKGFEGTTLGTRPQVFVPLTMRGLMNPGWTGFEDRRSYWLYVFGRLKPGVSLQQAAARLDALYHPIVTDVEASLQTGMSDQTMARFKARRIVVNDGRRGQSSLHTECRTPLMFLFGITGLVLLIASTNIANLLLARGAQRSGEVAVRLALCATRGQLLAQLLTESCLLALLGGAASLLVGMWTLSGIRVLLPGSGEMSINFGLEGRALLFTALLSLATGTVFGMFPALHSTRPDLIGSIRVNAGLPAGARAAARFRSSLVTAQIALSMALLIAAGLFVRSLLNISRVDLGLRADNVITFGVSPELNGYTNERSRVLFERMREELAAIPDVTGVTASRVPLLAGNSWGVRMALGSDERQVRALVMRQVLRVTAIGGAIGILVALALGRAVRSLLYGLAGGDPIVVVLAVVALASVALFAGYLPALRASRVHPAPALRYE